MKTIGLTGVSQTGKDKFIEFLKSKHSVDACSWVDVAKKIFADFGVKDFRDPNHRKSLSNMIDILDDYEIPFNYIYNQNLLCDKDYHVIVFRTPIQAEYLRENIDNIKIVKLIRDVEVPDNHADKSVCDVDADFIIDNNGSLGDFYYEINKLIKLL